MSDTWTTAKLRRETATSLQLLRRLEEADGSLTCECCSCGNRYPFKAMHGGHFIGGRSNAVLFVEDNIHPQCIRCNTFMGGNPSGYIEFMRRRYGESRVAELQALRFQTKGIDREALKAMRKWYLARIREQKERLGIT